MQTQRWVLWQGLHWAAQRIAGWAETHQRAAAPLGAWTEQDQIWGLPCGPSS